METTLARSFKVIKPELCSGESIQHQTTASEQARKQGRPMSQAADWRRLDNGAYDKRPCAKSEYFRVYAKTHACVKVVCPTCGRTLNKQELPGHQNRPICARRAAKIA